MSVFNGAVGHEINSEAMKAASWVRGACLVVENRKQKCLSVLGRPLAADWRSVRGLMEFHRLQMPSHPFANFTWLSLFFFFLKRIKSINKTIKKNFL